MFPHEAYLRWKGHADNHTTKTLIAKQKPFFGEKNRCIKSAAGTHLDQTSGGQAIFKLFFVYLAGAWDRHRCAVLSKQIRVGRVCRRHHNSLQACGNAEGSIPGVQQEAVDAGWVNRKQDSRTIIEGYACD